MNKITHPDFFHLHHDTYRLSSSSKIYIAGHTGMVGSAIWRNLESKGCTSLIGRTSKELDLCNQEKVKEFFKKEKPEFVFLAAAKVGGILANNTYRAEFIYENLQIQNNVIHQSYVHGVKKLLFLGSSCIYPKHCPQPMKEKYLLTGELEQTNEPYAISKIAGVKLCESYNSQYGTDYRSVMPTNLYGINDNFHPENSHVIPALMRRIHEAKRQHHAEVVVWGSGKPWREFLCVDDMAEACIFVLELDREAYLANTEPMLSHINVGTGEEITIGELAENISEVVGYKGRITFDTSKPDGTPRKLIDTTLLTKMGWQYKIKLKQGLEQTYQWYQEKCAKDFINAK